MAYQKTLLELRTSLARKLGVDGATGDTASADLIPAVLNEFINDGIEEAWDIIVGKWADFYTKATTIAVTSGTDAYTFPTDFLKLRRLWILTGSGVEYRRLFPADLDAAHQFTGDTVANKNYRYRMMARSLILMPVPGSTETLKLFYIPIATQLVDDGDVLLFDVPMEFRLVLAIAWRQCLDRQNLDPSPAIALVNELTAKVRTSADSRDAGEPFYLSPRQGFDEDDEWDLF